MGFYSWTKENISIHSLRMEGDKGDTGEPGAAGEFQSTPSAWRETKYDTPRNPMEKFQSTPSAWRETDGLHLPRSIRKFQSTPSAWRETQIAVLIS